MRSTWKKASNSSATARGRVHCELTYATDMNCHVPWKTISKQNQREQLWRLTVRSGCLAFSSDLEGFAGAQSFTGSVSRGSLVGSHMFNK